MYAHVFNFRFAEGVSPSERMRCIAEMLDLPLSSGYSATDIYWYRADYTGFVECYSNRPEVTNLVGQWLSERESQGILQQINPGLKSKVLFLARVFLGLK